MNILKTVSRASGSWVQIPLPPLLNCGFAQPGSRSHVRGFLAAIWLHSHPGLCAYSPGAMYPVTRDLIPDVGEVFVQVIVGSLFVPEKPGVSNKTVPSA